jgi:aldehyde dehydrogenase (NAD+)
MISPLAELVAAVKLDTCEVPRGKSMNKILERLGLSDVNPGAWLGSTSLEDKSETLIESVNPANGEVIASVRSTNPAQYDTMIAHAQESFQAWRKVPAPARGEAVRLVGNALRDNKDALGSLVSLEMGKIKVEGDGEVQEMIDIADFAVGQSRMLKQCIPSVPNIACTSNGTRSASSAS